MERSNRLSLAITMTFMMLATSVLVFAPAGSGADGPAPARAEDRFYLDGSFFIPSGWDRSRMYLEVFLQNRDREWTHDVTGQGNYKASQVANSFEALMDGNTHSSGDKRRVMLEIFTDTDCFYCPGADGAAHRIAERMCPQNISVIEWHVQTTGEADSYETTYSRARYDFYGLTGTPTAVVDGQLIMVGGDANWNNYEIDRAYERMIDLVDGYPALASFTMMGSFVPNASNYEANINVSVQLIDALPQGNWSLVASLCEDMYDPEKVGEFHRFIPRYTKSVPLNALNINRPKVVIDNVMSFGSDEEAPVRDNVTIRWSASDPQDGTDLTIDIRYQLAFGEAGTIATGLANTGSYVWRSREPRLMDGIYQMIVVATDSDGNRVSDYSRIIDLDNLDQPLLEVLTPEAGGSISGRYYITWNSSDDEDERIDLLVKISLSGDLGSTWQVLTYLKGEDWEVDDGTFDFNTAVWEDLDTYMLRVQIKDRTEWSIVKEVGPFEIYNNEFPKVKIVEPTPTQVQTGTMFIAYELSDAEDGAAALILLANLRKVGVVNWTEIYNATPPALKANMSVPTTTLSGDGEYELKLVVFDSRGGLHTASVIFPVYDPDAPEILTITVPTESVAKSFKLEWNATDTDAGETLSYAVFIRPASGGNWSELVKGLKEMEYSIDVSGLPDGEYHVKVLAVDSSGYHLKDEMESATFVVDNPQNPSVDFISPAPGFRGTIDNRTLNGYLYAVQWAGSDPDGGKLTYVLYYRIEGSVAWVPLFEDTAFAGSEFVWNVSKFADGLYYLKVAIKDDTGLTGEKVIGSFTLKKPVPYKPPVIPPDDDKGNNGSSEIDLVAFLMVGGIVLVVVVVLAVLVAVVLGISRKKKPMVPVVPKEEDVDLSVPDFDRDLGATTASEAQEPAEDLVAGKEVPHDENTGKDQ
jgi:hypothetical protein